MTRLHKSLLLFAIALGLFTLGRALLYVLYPQQFAQLGFGQVLSAFGNGLRFDGAVIARVFAIPFVLMNLPLRCFDRRGWFAPLAWLAYVLTLGMVLLLVGDVFYFEQVRRHVSYELLLLRDDWGFMLHYAFGVYWWALLLFALFALALGWLWQRILRGELRTMRWAALQYVALFLALAIVGRGGVGGKVIEIIDAYDNGDSAYGHLSLNGVFTTMVFSLNLDPVDHHFYPQEQAVAIMGEQQQILDPAYPMLQRYDAEPTGHNLVFVLLESWNFDYVDSFSGGSIGATPNFDALARDGLKFSRFYAAGQRSIEGVQATLTGIPALKGLPRIDAGIGVSNFTRLGAMAERHGYHTVFVQSSDRDSFKIQGVARSAGFKEFYGKEDIPLLLNYPDPTLATFGWDYDMLMFLKGKLDQAGKPFLAYAFTGTTHTPYPELDGHVIRTPHGLADENGYINALHYSDWSVGEFINAARQQPWFANTIFIFTADHATHFQQGGLRQLFHTPFLVYAPGIVPAGTNHNVSSQLDVMPTIIDLLGFPDEFAALGQSVFRKTQGQAFVTEGGQSIALITDHAHLKHNLHERLETAGEGLSEAGFMQMERQLLARDQLSYELLRDNRWAR